MKNARRRRQSIITKFIMLTSSLIVVTASVIAVYVIRSEKKQSYAQLLGHGLSVAGMMAQSSEYAIYTESKEALRQLTDPIERDGDIAYACILNRQRQVLVYKSKNAATPIRTALHRRVTAVDESVHEEYFNQGDGGYYIDVIVPVLSVARADAAELFFLSGRSPRQEVIGYIQLGLSQQGLRRRVSTFLSSTVFVTALFVSCGIVLTVLMTRRIASPIRRLSQATRQISEGMLDQRLDVTSNDEIKELAESFNDMTDRLRNYRTQVEQHTVELSSTNQKLVEQIQEREKTEVVLLATKARLQHLLIASPAVIYSCKPGDDFGFTFMSENVTTLLGYEPRDFLENPKFRFQHIYPDDRNDVLDKMSRLSEQAHYVMEYRFQHRDGAFSWLRDEVKLLYDTAGNPVEIIGYWVDITERKVLEEQLLHDAFHDLLTNLPNRALFLDRLKVSLARSKRHTERRFALLFIDLDRFKNINDSLGHLVGDQVLVAVARKLQRCVRPEDTVARLGGDEFAVMLDDIKDIEEAKQVAERILHETALPVTVNDQEVFTTASIGIAVGNDSYERAEYLLRDADTAMYHAKASGKACHAVFDDSMHDKAVTYLQIENDLRRAVERKEFIVHYQPIISLESGRISGFEALIRWNHPQKGLMFPNQFIWVAEETGLIVQIGRWMLREACRQLSVWQQEYPTDPPLTVSVNLSIKQFVADLVSHVEQVLAETGVHPGTLRLEITESIIMENPDAVNLMLLKLKDLNVMIDVDDFGTGYSSMGYLHRLPIDALKIDRSFIRGLHLDEGSSEIVKAIVMLASNLNMEVIGEGVEVVEQLNHLRSMNCTFVQGYLFSKPVDTGTIGEILDEELRSGAQSGEHAGQREAP